MVAIKKIQSPKTNLKEDTSWQITLRADAFTTPFFATARKRERRDWRRVAKNHLLQHYKAVRPGNIANGVQNPFISIKFAILSHRDPQENKSRGEKTDDNCRLNYWVNLSYYW